MYVNAVMEGIAIAVFLQPCAPTFPQLRIKLEFPESNLSSLTIRLPPTYSSVSVTTSFHFDRS